MPQWKMPAFHSPLRAATAHGFRFIGSRRCEKPGRAEIKTASNARYHAMVLTCRVLAWQRRHVTISVKPCPRRVTLLTTVPVLLALAGVGAAETAQSFSGRRIASVEMPGIQPLDQRDLAESQPIRPGDTFSAEAIADAIDRLFATGRFADIRVEADPAPDGGVVVRFVTEAQWFVGHLGVDGKVKNPPNRGNVLNVTGISLAQPFDDKIVPEAERRIKSLLSRNGLYEGTVSTKLVREPDAQQVQLTFLRM